MTNGSSQGLFVIVAVVIFGIFVFISYILFRDTMKPSLASIFCDSFTETENRTGIEGAVCGDSGKDSEINTDDLLETQKLSGHVNLYGSGFASIKDKSNNIATSIEGYANFGRDDEGLKTSWVINNYIQEKINPSDDYTIYSLNNFDYFEIDVKDSATGKSLEKNEFKVLLNGKEMKVVEGEYSLELNTSEILNNLKFKGYSENTNLEFVKGDILGTDTSKGGYQYKTSDTLTILSKNEKIEMPLQLILGARTLS